MGFCGRCPLPDRAPPPPAGPTPPSSGSSTPSSPSSTSSARGTSGSSSRSCWRCWRCSCWACSSTASRATWSRSSWGREPHSLPQPLPWRGLSRLPGEPEEPHVHPSGLGPRSLSSARWAGDAPLQVLSSQACCLPSPAPLVPAYRVGSGAGVGVCPTLLRHHPAPGPGSKGSYPKPSPGLPVKD